MSRLEEIATKEFDPGAYDTGFEVELTHLSIRNMPAYRDKENRGTSD